MNKIYKVIWSKVKHQYVVVSELAHSNGKQSRTSRNSIRSRIAALVVCGAITAFGVYGALPNSAFAEVAGGEATQSQYIAIAIEGNPGEGNNDATWHKGSWPFQEGYWELNDEKRYGDYTYIRQTVTVGDSQKQYWVRKGYDITAIQGERHESINNNTDYIIDAKKNAQYDASSDQGLLQAYQTTTSKGKITTLTGVNIEDLDTGVYGGASNTSGVTTPSTFGYHIKVGGVGAASDGYIRVTNDPKSSNANFSTYFSHDINLENNGSYSYINSNGEKVIVPSNKVYSIDGKLGVFTDAKGNLYTGDVYGDNNEILLSGSDGNKIYSYWGTKINDLSQTIGNMTVQDYNSDRKKLQDQAAAYHGDDITNIAVGGANNNGTISLNRVGQYNDQTGEYETTDPVPGTITVTSTGGNGGSGAEHDVKIKFSNTENPDGFSVDAGSKVEAVPGENDKISAIKINGEKYNLGTGGTITGSFNPSTGEISVEQDGKSVLAGKIHDYALDNQEKTASDGSVTLTGRDRYGTDTFDVKIDGLVTEDNLGEQIKTKNNLKVEAGDKGRWTITDTSKEEGSQVFTNTTLADKVETSGTKDSGYTYTVKDTAGNTAQLTDIASATKLSEVNKQVNTNTENIASLDGRVTVNEGNITDLGDRVTVNEGDITDLGNRVTVNEGDITDLGNRVTVNEGDITTIKGNMITGGQGNDDGTITLTGAEGKNIATVTGLHDYALENQEKTASDGSVTLTGKDRYSADTFSVKINGLVTEDNLGEQIKTKNNLKVAEGDKGRWTITDASQDNKVFTNTTLADEVETSGTKDSGYTYTVKDTAGNTAQLTDIASATKLSEVNKQVNTNTENIASLDGRVTVNEGNITDLGDRVTVNEGDITDLGNRVTVNEGDITDLGNRVTVNEGDITTIKGNMITGGQGNDDGTITLTGAEGKNIATVTGLHDYAIDKQDVTVKDGSVSLKVTDRYDKNNTYDVTIDGIVTDDTVATKNNLKVEAGEKGRWTITDTSKEEGSQVFTNTTLADKVEKTGDKDSGYTYTVKDTAGNTAVIKDVASAEKLSSVDSKVGDTNYSSTNYIHNEDNLTTAASTLDSAIKATADKVDAGWALYSDGNKIKDVKPGDNWISVDAGENVSISKNENGNGLTISADLKDLDVEDTNAVLYDDDDKTTVTLAGTSGTRITNVAKGDISEKSTEAVNGSQLYATNQKVDAGWTATDGKTGITVSPTNNTLKFAGDNNITVTADAENNAINVELNPDVNLKGEGKNSDNRVWLSGSNGTITVTTENNLSEKTTVINGGNVYVGSSVSVGDKVEITDKDITGLSNTSWNGTTDDESRAATEGQLKDVSDTVNAGWTATDSNGASIVVNPENGSTLNFAGDRNIEVKANKDNNSIDVSLSDDVVLGGKEGTSRVEIGGTNGTIMATKDPNSMAATTTIDGGNVYVGSSISVGDKVEITDKDITGLSNTSWNGTTDDESRAATEGQLKDVSDTVNAGWTATDSNGASIVVNPENGSTLNFAGDRNIEVKANKDNNSIDVSLSDDVVLGGKEGTSRVEIGGTNGTIMATKDPNSMAATTTIDGGNVYVGSSISVGDKVEITDKDITGLSNTSWNGTTDDESRAATEGQLKDVSDTVNAGWTATDSNGASIVVNPENGSTLNFAGDRNIEVKANKDNNSIDVSLSDDVVLGGKEGTSRVEIGGTNGTIMATKDPNSMAATTTIDGGNVYVGSSISVGDKVEITDKDITGLSNTEWNGTTTTPDRAATEGQLQQVSNDVNAGWIATDNNGSQVNITPDNNKLNFAGDENITVTAANNEIKTTLNDDIVLGDYLNGDDGVLIGGSSGTISATNSITVGEDQGLVIDGQKKEIQGLSNTTWNEKIANDAAVEGSTAASTAATQGQLQEVSKVANAGWTASDGTNSISVKPNETLNFVGDENLTVSADGTDKELKVSLNDDITLGDGENAIKIDGTNGTLNIGSTFAVAEDGTVLSDGDVIADADGEKYSLSEVGKYAVRYDKTNDGTSTITLVDGDDLSGTRIKNVADGVDPKDAVNVSQLEAVEATANAGWTASDGTNSISIKPNETLNFVGDENLTVSADGTDKKLKVSLNDDITLGNTEAGNTEGERSFTINTTDPNGYVPESYKTGSGANFIEENGGFMLFATDTQGFGVFGVTAKGSAWARDFKTYTTDIYGNNTQYSLNAVGDAVAQMSSYYNGKNSYTVFSRYLNEAEKDNPFVTVDEDGNTINATRDIPLALRDDGAVLIGATIKGEDFTDNGIRINAETKTTYDKNGNEVTNNIATITGLENTEWKPPTPVATFAANDGSATVTSRAATESQLNDLYSAVAAYDVNVDGTIDYSHIALAGTPYGASRSGNGTHTGGTSITNVAYASGKDGSEAVNVDYLNDAISDAAENGSISTSDQHLVANTETGSNGVYKPNDDGNVNLIVSDEKGNSSTITIGDVASKEDLDNLKDDVGDLDYSKVEGDTIIDGDSVTDAIGKLDNKIDNITGTATDADNNTVTGGKINSDGTISLTQKDKDSIKLEGQLTDSGVVQEGTSFDKETGTITITSQDKYSGETSSVKVEGIASTEVVGATNKEDLATAYKDADKDGNATTEYITDSESMVEADVALDHAIQDVAGTSYANDMVLSNRIDSVEKRLGNVEERIDKVGAMAAAIANLRTMGFDPEAPTEIAIGVGQYKSETGIAIGVFHYPNQDFMLSASLSSSGDELMGGIGATWKLGRKSAAERAKDEEARHLEQAEEMKKLAQQEKVKAQAQRHAKLLAERQQASQKNA